MLKVKLQYFGHLMERADSLEKTPVLGQIEGRRRRRQRMRWLDGIINKWIWIWANSGRWWRTGKPGMLWSRGRKESDTTEKQQQELTVQLWERISIERRDEFKTFSELDVSDVEEWKWWRDREREKTSKIVQFFCSLIVSSLFYPEYDFHPRLLSTKGGDGLECYFCA